MKFEKIVGLLTEVEDPKEEKEDKEKSKETPKEIPKDKKPEEENPDEEKKDKEEEEPDPDEEFEKEDGADTTEEDQLQADIEAKFEDVGDKVMKGIEQLLDTKSSVILGKIQNVGIDETVRDYMENYFMKSLDNNKDKVFISLNMDELIPFIAQKISVEYLKK